MFIYIEFSENLASFESGRSFKMSFILPIVRSEYDLFGVRVHESRESSLSMVHRIQKPFRFPKLRLVFKLDHVFVRLFGVLCV